MTNGVESIKEPTERFYGIDCAIRDRFGSHIRITQPAEGPIEPATPSKDAAGA
jgi:hypothetical protein